MTDDTGVTGSENPSTEDRLGILEDAVGFAHRRLNQQRGVLQSHEFQVIVLAFGVTVLAVALIVLVREGVTDGPVT